MREWDPDTREWRGSVCNRLVWMLFAETGIRLGEALGLQHRDWHTGCGDTPYVEVVARDPRTGCGPSAATGGCTSPTSWTASTASTSGGCARSAPTWPPTTSTAPAVPQAWTPHWMRHSHATALLLSGVPVHVVSRRLGHVDVQTTLNTYAHVTEDTEMRAPPTGRRSPAAGESARTATTGSSPARDRRARRGHDRLGGSGPRPLRPAGAGGLVGGGAGTDAAGVLRRVECPTGIRGSVLPRRDLAGRGGPVATAGADAPGGGVVCSGSSSWVGRSRHRG